MLIGIDIRSACHRKTGKGYYTRHLVKALLKKDKKNEYILYSDKSSKDFPSITRVWGRSIFWHLNLLRHLKRDKPSVFFSPTSYIIPSVAGRWLKTVFTVHDLVAFLFPTKNNKKAAIIEHLTLARALSKSECAICVSKNTAKDLQERFVYPNSRIRLVYCAAGDEFKILTNQEVENVKNKYKLPEKFILAVGTIEPRKNLGAIVEAFTKVKNDITDLHLVIIGTKGWGGENIRRMIKQNHISNRTIFPGYVEYEDLAGFYNLAQIFIFSSIYEGFGMPPLEAMKCGCPVICSNTSSLPEVVGDAAYMIDPHAENQIEQGIRSILGDPKFAEHLRQKGLKQATKFSWESSAKELLKILESCKT